MSEWTTVIKPKSSLLSVDFGEIWQYRDLYRMFVKRDIVTWYKQTILGPLWFFIQPIMTTVMFMVVFGGIAKISTDGLPRSPSDSACCSAALPPSTATSYSC